MKSLRQLDEREEPSRDVPFPIARWAPIPLRLIVGYGFMEHGFVKLARGSDAFATILDAIGVPAPHFMAWSTDRSNRWISSNFGCVRGACQLTDGCGSIGGDVYCASALGVQFDQAIGRDCCRRAVRAPPAMKLTSCTSPASRPCLGWFWTTGDRWPYQETETMMSIAMRFL